MNNIEEQGGMGVEAAMPSAGVPLMGENDSALPSAASGSQPVTDEQKQQLLLMIETIRQKLNSFKASHFANNNVVEKTRRDLLKQMFEKMQLAGIDLTDQRSVAAFMEKLRQQSPELAAQFEDALNFLLTEESMGEPGGQPNGLGIESPVPGQPQMPQQPNEIMNPQNNENLPQGV